MFSRRQALEAGYTTKEIRVRLRPGGAWVSLRRGWYCERESFERLGFRDQWLLRDRAAWKLSSRPSVLSHDSAARLLGIDALDVEEPGTHLSHRGANGSSTYNGVSRHKDALPMCVEVVDGLPTTSYARTAIDIGRLHGFRHGLVAVDSVRHMGVPLDDLQAELRRMEHHPDIAQSVSAVEHSDDGAESVLETLGRELVSSMGLGPIRTQVAVRLLDGRAVWVDFVVGRQAFECEGLIKLLSPGEGGVAKESASTVARKQQGRWAQISAAGFGVTPIYWDDCFGSGRDRARTRLMRDFEATVRRYGTALSPDLEAFADAHPRRRAGELWDSEDLRRAA